MRILMSKAFSRFSRQEGISDDILVRAVREIEAGLIHADLGGGLIKQRIARPGGGKSGGFRTVLVWRRGDLAVFLLGFAKSMRSNLTEGEAEIARATARSLLRMGPSDLARVVAEGKLREIDHGR